MLLSSLPGTEKQHGPLRSSHGDGNIGSSSTNGRRINVTKLSRALTNGFHSTSDSTVIVLATATAAAHKSRRDDHHVAERFQLTSLRYRMDNARTDPVTGWMMVRIPGTRAYTTTAAIINGTSCTQDYNGCSCQCKAFQFFLFLELSSRRSGAVCYATYFLMFVTLIVVLRSVIRT